ncbi:hypothetical protein ACVBEJ_04395 [Porticoccus sp. GXU_MW_L64]
MKNSFRTVIARSVAITAAGLLMASLPVSSQAAESLPDNKKTKKPVRGDSAIVTLQSTITGNREQPKVLYIVPWQAPDGPEALRQGFQSDLDELFRPVERNEFLRQLKHRGVPLTTAPQKDK